MTTQTNSVETSVADVFRTVLEDTSGDVFAVGFDERQTEVLVGVLADLTDPPAVRLLVRESVLKWLRGDFLTASVASEQVDDETLALRTVDAPLNNTLLVTDEAVVAVVTAGETVAGLWTEEEQFVAAARDRWSETFEDAEAFSLRTPPRSRVHETLGTELGPNVESDFRTMLTTLDTARGNGDGLDEVVVSLLAAAKNEILLYDVSKWGEDVGVASKATFSRTKTRLEERGLIATEKVPLDVGRPRLRLMLGDERLRDADADELASVAQGLLSTAD